MNYVVLVIGIILGIMCLCLLTKDIYRKIQLHYILNKEYDVNSLTQFLYDLLHISFPLMEYDAIIEKLEYLSELQDENHFEGESNDEPKE